MRQFVISANQYLCKSTSGYYHLPYTGFRNPGNPDYVNVLKNTFNSCSSKELTAAAQELHDVLRGDLPQVLAASGLRVMTVCVVPRAKAEGSYRPSQLLFRLTVRATVGLLNGLDDGTSYLLRQVNTRTTHLRNPIAGHNNDGPEPFPGITAQTCRISDGVIGRDILLVDDVYTPGVNIDEDAIQALLGARARSVTFYAVGKVQGANRGNLG